MTQPDPKHLLPKQPNAPKTDHPATRPKPCPPNVTLLCAILLIGLPSYATGAQQRDDSDAWSAAREVAPLAPPIPHELERKTTAPGPASTKSPCRRQTHEELGGDLDCAVGGSQRAAGGQSNLHQPPPRHFRPLQKLRDLCQQLKHKRLERRQARQHRRAERPLVARLRERRAHH